MGQFRPNGSFPGAVVTVHRGSISQDRTSKPEESSAKISGCDGHREIFAPQFRCCNTHVSKLINIDTVAVTDATAVANFFMEQT